MNKTKRGRSFSSRKSGRESRRNSSRRAKTSFEDETAGDSYLHADEKEGWTTWPEGWP